MKTRKPAVAGLFYPEDPGELREQVSNLLALATPDVPGRPPKALIVPHAGYIYSGPVAAQAYGTVRDLRDRIHRVVLLGPAHRIAFSGFAVPSTDVFETPLGNVPIDQAAIANILDLPGVQVLDEAHAQEHSLEVQLPFLQLLFSEFSLVPIVVGEAGTERTAEVLERLWDGPETLIVISSDLSHYLDYETARARDSATAAAIKALDYRKIDYQDACGRNPLSGLLLTASRHGLRPDLLDLRNSGDTAGSRDRVVGYSAWALSDA